MAIDRGEKELPKKDPDELIDELEEKIDRLRISYFQYFQGIEKKEPQWARSDAARAVRELRRLTLKPGPRFRFLNLASRFAIFEEQWNRTLKKIEEGKFRPHLFKLHLHEYGRAAPARMLTSVAAVMRAAPSHGAAPASESAPASALAPTAAPAGASNPAEPSPVSSPVAPIDRAAMLGLRSSRASDAQGRASESIDVADLYQTFVAARRQTGESTGDISIDDLRNVIDKQVPLVREQHGCDRVDFKVVIRAGKAILRAIPVGNGGPPRRSS